MSPSLQGRYAKHITSLKHISDGTLEKVTFYSGLTGVGLTCLTVLFSLAFNFPSLNKAKFRSKMSIFKFFKIYIDSIENPQGSFK